MEIVGWIFVAVVVLAWMVQVLGYLKACAASLSLIAEMLRLKK